MKIAVWDTYVTRKDGRIMHFDILVEKDINDKNKIFEYGTKYLKIVSQDNQTLTSKECKFCHIEIAPDVIESQILKYGYFIIEMENCK